MTTDEKEIKDGIVEHFQNIFQTQASKTVSLDSMSFNKILADMKLWIESEITEEECLAAMKKLGQNKAP